MTERDARGRFTKENGGGPGRPRLDEEQQYLKALRKALPDKEIAAIVEMLLGKAKKGDVRAAQLLLEYAIGKPTAYVSSENMNWVVEFVDVAQSEG